MSDQPDRLPTADVVAEAIVEHERAEVERGLALDRFVAAGMDRDTAREAAGAWARAYKRGDRPPSITGRVPHRDPNSR